MLRFAANCALALAALAPVSANAASYSATLSAPTAQAKIVARDISWACVSGACRGATESSRPVVLCQGLAKQAGQIAVFNVDGRTIGADDLRKCNAFAKGGATAALAKAN